MLHGPAWLTVLTPPLAVTITPSPSSTAATRGLGGDRAATGHRRDDHRPGAACQRPPHAGRPVTAAPEIGGARPGDRQNLAVDHLERLDRAARGSRWGPPLAAVGRLPQTVAEHEPDPTDWRTGFPTRPASTTPGCGASGATGAGSPRQLAPRSRVRRIDVHGAFAHGAVPRTNASSVETNVTEVAANPIGTGPPDGTATVDVLAAVAGAAGVEEAAPPAAGAAAELAPPDPAGPLDDAGEVAAAAPPDPELVGPAGRQRHRRQQGAAREPDPCRPQRCVHEIP